MSSESQHAEIEDLDHGLVLPRELDRPVRFDDPLVDEEKYTAVAELSDAMRRVMGLGVKIGENAVTVEKRIVSFDGGQKAGLAGQHQPSPIADQEAEFRRSRSQEDYTRLREAIIPAAHQRAKAHFEALKPALEAKLKESLATEPSPDRFNQIFENSLRDTGVFLETLIPDTTPKVAWVNLNKQNLPVEPFSAPDDYLGYQHPRTIFYSEFQQALHGMIKTFVDSHVTCTMEDETPRPFGNYNPLIRVEPYFGNQKIIGWSIRIAFATNDVKEILRFQA